MGQTQKESGSIMFIHCFHLAKRRGNQFDRGVLREVQNQERNEEPAEHNHEERQEGGTGHLPNLWYQAIPHRRLSVV
jgi:hypothetical protein